MKRILFLLVFTVVGSSIFISAYKKEEKNKLFCRKDGSFTILVVSDPQCENQTQWKEARDELEILILKSDPDFVLINGDMNSKNEIDEKMWELFIFPLTSRNIYWSTTNGNHDPFNQKNYEIYKKYNHCLNLNVNKGNINYESTRPMNYTIPIYSNDKEKIVFVIYGMDSGTSNEYGYEGLTKKQIDWYVEQSNKYKKKNNQKAVTSLLCVHIPFTQTLDMFYSCKKENAGPSDFEDKLYKIYGVTNQKSSLIKDYTCENGTFLKETFINTTAPQNDRGMFEKILQQGDIKAVFFGHEHKTNIIGSYKGVLLGFAGKLSTGCYSDNLCRGGRVLSFNQQNPEKFTVCWLGSMQTSVDQPQIYSNGREATQKH